MQHDAGQDSIGGNSRDCVNPYTEALVLLQVFSEPEGYPRARIDAELSDLDPGWVSSAIESLDRAGVIEVKQTAVYPSEQLNRLVALNVIAF